MLTFLDVDYTPLKTDIALWPGGAVIVDLRQKIYGKLCQTQPINLQLRKFFDQGASSG